MKLYKSLLLGMAGMSMLSFTSCNDWLDINTDPDNPTDVTAPYQQRLAHIQFYTNDANQFAAWRTTMAMGDWTKNDGGGTYTYASDWYPTDAMVTTPYQWFFVGANVNSQDMYDKALAAGNYQYAGAAKLLRAYGFMLMTDLYGEMPYTQACTQSATPEYDTGRTIFMGCISDIEEAIELLKKGQSQDSKLPTLAEGDSWNGGSVDKWIKLAYLFKARWLNHLTKKGAGSYKDGKYDANEILTCLDNAMQSNADNSIVNHTDNNSSSHDVLGWDEPVDYSPLYSVSGMNSGYMPTKMLYDNLTNFAGCGIEDPRADHILPWAKSVKSATTPAEIKWNGNWRRSMGVDLQSSIRTVGGPLRAIYNKDKGQWYCKNAAADRVGDTIYVEGTSSSKGYAANVDLLYRNIKGVDGSAESGTFYTRVSSPTYIGTYSEACFIRAEVLFNQGNKAAAYEAYVKGVRASMELMNSKLSTWIGEDASLKNCPSFVPMEQTDIDNYIQNGLGTAGDITLGKIFTQKRLALHFSMEIWNDMRRYDFNPEYFLGWNIPAAHDQNVDALKAIPAGKQYRRWRQCGHEYNYNSKNLQAIGSQVPGAVMVDSKGKETMWNRADDAWTINVWWDSDQQ